MSLILVVGGLYSYYQPSIPSSYIDGTFHPNVVKSSPVKPTTIAMTIDDPYNISKIKTGVVNAVILGDSISVSQGASDPKSTGWNIDLGTKLHQKHFGYINWINLGRSGITIDYCLEKAEEITSDVDVVFICVGRNDRNIYTPDQFDEKYSLLIKNIKAINPNIEIYLIIEPPMVSLDDSVFNGIRETIFKVANKTDCITVDVWSAFPEDQVKLGLLLSDGLHPNDDGYIVMSDYISNILGGMIENNKTIVPKSLDKYKVMVYTCDIGIDRAKCLC